MKAGCEHLRYRPLRAPSEDRAALVEPPWEEVSTLLAENLRRRAQHDCDLQGCRLSELARRARSELLAEAHCWTASYRDVDRPGPGSEERVFLAGHQPQLFHPGVWFKNFALGALAAQHRAAAVNLMVDSDTMKQHTVLVPGGSVAQPQVEAVPLDRPLAPLPFEERRIADREVLADFGRRAARRIAPLVPHPMLEAFWPLVLRRAGESDHLGACLAQARHQWEAAWGLDTLEIPQSRVCQLESFAWFACHLLAQLPRLRTAHNEALAAYRRIHRVRSAAQPVPDLAADGPWLEAPFWIWTADDPRRRRLFVRQCRAEARLTDRERLEVGLPLEAEGPLGRAVDRWADLARQGIRIRSRALVTTLWARLALGDLFLHGIGGAKYDQVTDALISRFFGLAPPGFMVLSATLLLPIPRQRPSADELRKLQRRLRELTYHPERFMDARVGSASGSAEPSELIDAKRRWIATPQTPQNARTRCREIRRINEALQPWVSDQRRQLQQRLACVGAGLRAESVLASREYSFCLYPEETLREFLAAWLPRGG